MNTELTILKNDLLMCNQQHLFADPIDPSKPLAESLQVKLLEELHSLSYPGGAAGYVQTAQQLLGTLPTPAPKLQTVHKEADGAPERCITDVALPCREVMYAFPTITDPTYADYPAKGSEGDKVYVFPPELAEKLPEPVKHKHTKEINACRPLVAIEEYGLQLTQDVIFVLVAGGLGERLGYKGIKVSLPLDTAGYVMFLEHFITFLSTAGRNAVKGNTKPLNPFVIMTSDDTHVKTLQLLQTHNCFGYDQNKIIIMRQETVPCLTDQQAHIALNYVKDANGQIVDIKLPRKPHGHGDVHQLLYQLTENSALTAAMALKNGADGPLVLSSGVHQRDAKGKRLVDKWFTDEGFRNVVFIQDTNAMAMATIPFSLAAMHMAHLKMILTCVPRREAEAVGIFCRQVFRAVDDGSAYDISKHPKELVRIGNVEYNIFKDLYTKVFEGRPKPQPDSEGNSPFPGSINTLLVDLDCYAKALHQHHGKVPEFINPKYNPPNAEGVKTFKSPARVESLMQDIALVLSDIFNAEESGSVKRKIGCTVFGREAMEPVKNFLDDGLKAEHSITRLAVNLPTQQSAGGNGLVAEITSTSAACCGATAEEAILDFARNRFLNSAKAVLSHPIEITGGELQLRTKPHEDPRKPNCVLYEKAVIETSVIVNTPSGNTLPINLFPIISYDATFGNSIHALVHNCFGRKGNIKISRRSVLILHGKVKIESLELDGALTITNHHPHTTVVVEGLKVSNKGWCAVALESLSADQQQHLTEVDKMRGYKLVKHETAEYVAKGAIAGDVKLSGKL